MKVCNVPNCPNPTDAGRCTTHRKQARAARTGNRAYSTAPHRTFRTAVLTRDPICTRCHMQPSTEADHYPQDRRELERLGLNPNDPRYGRGLCLPCHSKETATNQPGGWHRNNIRTAASRPARRGGGGA